MLFIIHLISKRMCIDKSITTTILGKKTQNLFVATTSANATLTCAMQHGAIGAVSQNLLFRVAFWQLTAAAVLLLCCRSRVLRKGHFVWLSLERDEKQWLVEHRHCRYHQKGYVHSPELLLCYRPDCSVVDSTFFFFSSFDCFLGF